MFSCFPRLEFSMLVLLYLVECFWRWLFWIACLALGGAPFWWHIVSSLWSYFHDSFGICSTELVSIKHHLCLSLVTKRQRAVGSQVWQDRLQDYTGAGVAWIPVSCWLYKGMQGGSHGWWKYYEGFVLAWVHEVSVASGHSLGSQSSAGKISIWGKRLLLRLLLNLCRKYVSRYTD